MLKSVDKKELNKLAHDLVANNVFTSLQVQKHDPVEMVFMPLIFLDEEGRKQVMEAGMIYEYYDKAGPRGFNGMPTFMSFRILNKEDTDYVLEKYKKFQKMIDEEIETIET